MPQAPGDQLLAGGPCVVELFHFQHLLCKQLPDGLVFDCHDCTVAVRTLRSVIDALPPRMS